MNTTESEGTSNEPMENKKFQKLSDSDLFNFNRQGLIPGPDESEEAFSIRAKACLDLKSYLATHDAVQSLPFKIEASQSKEALECAYPLTKPLFDIQPDWLPLFFSNYKLTPWHGGCAWIFQLEEEGPRMAFLQLRKTFATNKQYLSLYQRDELIAHECAHVGRMTFDENRFEEILAYRTNHSPLRAWLGPIVQSATESLIFIALLFSLMLLDFYFIFSENYEAYFSLGWLKLLPVGLFLLALMRLWRRQKTFRKCLKQLQEVLGEETSANHVIYRLTDQEINQFALPQSSIIEYAQAESKKSLRWRLLWLAYFQNESKGKDKLNG